MQKACWVLIIFLVVLGGSCLDSDVCLRGADNALVIEFKKLSDGLSDTVSFLNIEATGADSVFYKTTPDVRDTLFENESAIVATNPYSDTTFFTFNDFNGETKILNVGYKIEVRFVSEECGSERLQYDLKVLETTFDSVRVVRNRLDKGQSTNIEIYH